MAEPTAFFAILIALVTAYTTWQGFQSPFLFETYVFEPRQVLRNKQYVRMVSSGFLHVNWMHYAFNMFSLYVFGKGIELHLGATPFLVIYFSSIVGGNGLSLWLHRHHEYRAVGASGGVCGVIFASMFLFPGGGVRFLLLPITISASVYAVLFIVISVFGMRSRTSRVGHDAHLGGALVGLLVATAMYPNILPASPVLYATVVFLTLLAIGYCYAFPMYLQLRSPWSRGHWLDVWSRMRRARDASASRTEDRQLDDLLDKVSEQGIHSLSTAERKKLESISKRRQRRR